MFSQNDWSIDNALSDLDIYKNFEKQTTEKVKFY